MENIVLTIHLLLALGLIGVVLMQRSEGGGLGIGGGGGGAMTSRGAATALAKVTWVLAIAFLGTSIYLTVLAADGVTGGSVVDRLGTSGAQPDATAPTAPLGDDLLPPPSATAPESGSGTDGSPPDTDEPLTPRADD
ncbi:preprotein translocase subunit SecG [Pontibaca methylaminivorans]|uniref:preprotein translocase subunit SecG n=1 Tax=Pontibaca methylaminivorans TaxID=515897 RepID=UPI002FD95007